MDKTLDQLPANVVAGLVAFRKKDFYAAHEFFEDTWRKTPGASREFFRALLHISGGFFRLTQSRPGAARKFFTHALKWLTLFPSPYSGINTDLLMFQLEKLIQAINTGMPCDMIQEEYFEPLRTLLDKRTP